MKFNNKKSSISPQKKDSILNVQRNTIIKILIITALVIGSIYFYPNIKIDQYSDFKLNSVAPREIIAPFDFNIYKSEQEYNKEVENALKKLYPVFFVDNQTNIETNREINRLFSKIDSLKFITTWLSRMEKEVPGQSNDEERIQKIRNYSAERDRIIESLRNRYDINITDIRFAFLLSDDKKEIQQFKNNVKNIVNELHKVGIINISKEEFASDKEFITVKTEDDEYEKNYSDFFDVKEAREKVSERFRALYGDSLKAITGYELVYKLLEPNYIYDANETEKSKGKIISSISRKKGLVPKNYRIVDSHQLIDKDIYDMIQSLRNKTSERYTNLDYALPLVGNSVLIMILLSFFIFYLYAFRKKIFYDNKLMFLIAIIILSQVFFAYLIKEKFDYSQLLIPTTIASILLTALFDGGVGFYGTVIISMILGIYLNISFEFTLLSFIAGVTAVYAVRKIKSRSQFYWSTVYIALGYFFTLTSFALIRSTPLRETIIDFISYSLPNALIAPMISAGFLAIFEKMFGITTDLTLLELSNLNNPLLKELLFKAPGTYNHSIMMGNLAESAAESIGANSLLARVGAYYHDIGKMDKASYFVENQMTQMNIHETLSPRISSLVLLSHTKKGVELAEKYKLPEVIKDFIEQHHGTSKMAFFYEKAKDNIDDEKYINESDYRYPGPKPQSKEAGIVMLADSIEAATRSIQEPTPKKIGDTIRQIVLNKLKEGQLDDCELTVRELSKITESITKLITGFYHRRVAYPGQKETPKNVIYSDEEKY